MLKSVTAIIEKMSGIMPFDSVQHMTLFAPPNGG